MTPLHLIISGVFEGRVEALLHNGTDVKIDGEFGKATFETASVINIQDLREL